MKKKVLAVLIAVLFAIGCGSENSSVGNASGGNKISATTAGVSDVMKQEMAKQDAASADTSEASSSEASVSVSELPSVSSSVSTEKSDEEPVLDPSVSDSPETSATLTSEEPTDVDIDLTILSSTMVYSQVFDMVTEPDKYIGQKVRMDGLFAMLYDEASGNRYFACVIQDATACCAQGIEFELEGEHNYPDDYPELSCDICVVGDFDTYMEGDLSYCTLRHAKIEKAEAWVTPQAQP